MYRDGEISLIDIVFFINNSYKIIIGFTFFGIVSALLYLWIAPNKYEAIAQIKMAQVANLNNNYNNSHGNSNNRNNIDLLGISIEEPQAMIARMTIPTSYSKDTLLLCGVSNQKDPAAALMKKVKFSIIKGVSGTAELKIRDTSKSVAKACIESVYQLIKFSQARLVEPYTLEAYKKLGMDQARLNLVRQEIITVDKSGTSASGVYDVARDEIRFLIDQISRLQNIISINENRTTELAAPIYLKDEPVSPQKYLILIIGLLSGAVLGILYGLARQWYQLNHNTMSSEV